MPDTTEIIRTTCPRDCYDFCGITVVKREAARAHVNVLNPGHKSDMGENTCVHGVEVMITLSG